MKKNIIYLASHTAKLKRNNVVYNDIKGDVDIISDMLGVNLEPYDILIATPPCNYYSRANYRRDTSKYSQETKHLLPDILKKFYKTKKPFIVENVINKVLMRDIIDNHILNGYFYKEHGRHSYFMSHDIDFSHLHQVSDNVQNKSRNIRQGGYNVNIVLDYCIDCIEKELENEKITKKETNR